MKEQLVVTTKGKDELSPALKKGSSALDMFSKAAVAATGAIAAAGAAFITFSVNKAAKFQTAITNISTLLDGKGTKAIDSLKKGILDLTDTIPKSAEELGAAAYDVVSAGIKGTAAQLKTLEAAGKLAVAGLGTTSEATDILTSAINAFGINAKDANKVANVLFKTVKSGKTTVSAMAQGFGSAASAASAAGVNLKELLAATASLTTTGVPAAEAYTRLRAVFNELQKPGDDLNKIITDLGFSSGKALIKSEGLEGALKKIRKEAGGTDESMANLFGSTEAFGAMVSLTGKGAKAFGDTLKDMESGSNSLGKAFNKQKQTFENLQVLLSNKVNKVMIRLGEKIIPVLAQGIRNVVRFLDENEEAINSLIDNGVRLLEESIGFVNTKISEFIGFLETARQFMEDNRGTIENLAIVIASFAIAWGIVNGAIAIYNGVIAIATFATSAFAAAAALVSSPIIIIIGVIGLLIAAIWLIAKNWDWIKEKTMETWNNIKDSITNKINNVREILVDWGSRVKETVTKPFRDAKKTIDGIWDGIKKIVSDASNLPNVFSSLTGGVGGLGGALGSSAAKDLFKIPGFAEGVNNFRGGMAVVGERGREIVELPRGSNVIPNRQTEEIINNNEKKVVVENVNINNNMDFLLFMSKLAQAI